MNWNEIEMDFKKWDEEGRFSASQRQILDWFKERIDKELEKDKILFAIEQLEETLNPSNYSSVNNLIEELKSQLK